MTHLLQLRQNHRYLLAKEAEVQVERAIKIALIKHMQRKADVLST